MDDGSALLRAIRASPEDDAPRLAFADWLDERAGGPTPRAELIRVSVELARLRQQAGNPPARKHPLAARIARLEDRRFDLFYQKPLIHLGGYPGGWRFLLAPPGYADCQYANDYAPGALFLSRGLAELAIANAGEWVEYGDRVLAEHPVREVRLAGWPDPFEDGRRRGLRNDPAGRVFGDAEVIAAHRADEPPVVDLLRCRWPEVETWRAIEEPVPRASAAGRRVVVDFPEDERR
jgi:uncharacterized protein (TIGR02996 family)